MALINSRPNVAIAPFGRNSAQSINSNNLSLNNNAPAQYPIPPSNNPANIANPKQNVSQNNSVSAGTQALPIPNGGITTPVPQVPSPPPLNNANLSFQDRLSQAYAGYNANSGKLPAYDPTKQQDLINNLFLQQQNAITSRNKSTVDQSVNNLEQQKQKLLPQYLQAQEQNEVQSTAGKKALAEQLAAQGLGASGEAVNRNAQLESGRVKGLADLNNQQIQNINDIDNKINQVKESGAADTNYQIAQLDSQKAQALIKLDENNQQWALKIYELQNNQQRQQLQDQISQINFEYQDKQSQINQAFQNKQFDAQQTQIAQDNAFREKQLAQQDALNKAQQELQNQQLALQKQSLEFSQSQASSGGGGSSSGGSSGSSYKNDNGQVTPGEYISKTLVQSEDPSILRKYGSSEEFLRENAGNIINDVGNEQYINALKKAQSLDTIRKKNSEGTTNPFKGFDNPPPKQESNFFSDIWNSISNIFK